MLTTATTPVGVASGFIHFAMVDFSSKALAMS